MREVRRLLPRHDLLYFADTAYCPYGPRPLTEIRARSLAIGRWLMERGAGLLLVACNTASSATLELLRAELPLPVVGMEPGLKPAVAASRNGRIGVLATSNTLAGVRFAALVERHAGGVEMLTQPCPGLVEQVEAGDLDGPATRALVERYLQPLLEEIAGPDVTLVDTGPAVAAQVVRVAARHALPSGSGVVRCWTSGDPATVAPVISRLLRENVVVESVSI